MAQAQWQSVMGTTPWKGAMVAFEIVKEGPDYPATFVSWDDAVSFARSCRNVRASNTACQPKQNGNMRAVREQRRRFRLATKKVSWANSPGMSRMHEPLVRIMLIGSDKSVSTLGDCTTCTETLKSGCRIGTALTTTRNHRRSIRKDRQRAIAGLVGAGRLPSDRTAARDRAAHKNPRRTTCRTLGSGWF